MLIFLHMGIEVQKSAFPTLFNFAKVRAAQSHVYKTLIKTEANVDAVFKIIFLNKAFLNRALSESITTFSLEK